MSPDADRRIADWISSMHFTTFDDAYNWIKNHQSGKVYKSQYEGLQHYFSDKEFVELPFIELQPEELLRQIQSGESINAPPISPDFGIEPSIQNAEIEEPPEPEEEPTTNPIQRIFNAIRGIFR